MLPAHRRRRSSVVYALVDAVGIRYIGATRFPKRRFLGHLSGKRNSKKLWLWIQDLRSRGERPRFLIIERFRERPYHYLSCREKFWINVYSIALGPQLLNGNGRADFISIRRVHEIAAHCRLKLRKESRWRNRPAYVPYKPLTLEYDGLRLTVAEWCLRLGISKQALYMRLKCHPLHVALSCPRSKGKRLVPTTTHEVAPV